MKTVVSLFLILFAVKVQANLKSSFIELSGGLPTDITIENPDATLAYYTGLAFQTKFHYSFGDGDTTYGLTLHYKYLNIKNTKSSDTTETGTHKGMGAGVFVKFSGFYLGANYAMMKATHEATGSVNALDIFEYNPITVDISYTIPYGSTLEIGPGYSYSTADLKAAETGLSKDAPYKEQILWLKLFIAFDKL